MSVYFRITSASFSGDIGGERGCVKSTKGGKTIILIFKMRSTKSAKPKSGG